MSHHNDICKKCYENINGCECHFDDGKSDKPNKRKLKWANSRRIDEVKEFISSIGQVNLLRDKEKNGIPEE